MKPAFAYYGGKGRLGPSWIVPNLPEHRAYAARITDAGRAVLDA